MSSTENGRPRLAAYQWTGLCLALALGCARPTEVRAAPWGTELAGVCDISAAVWQNEQLWVANDEDNRLRVFDSQGQLIRVAEPSLDQLVTQSGVALRESKSGVKEMDLEAVASLPGPDGPVVFWMGSHGNRKAKVSKGKVRDADARPNRHMLVATKLSKSGQVALVGKPVQSLGGAWLSAQLPADVTAALAMAQPRHANAGGWNLEGLAGDTTDAKRPALWFGFRSPVDAQGRSLVIRLDNPLDVVDGQEPKFGSAAWLDLGGRGIRALDVDPGGGWRIVAGPVDHVQTDSLELIQRSELANDFAIYSWKGPGHPAERVAAVASLRPEAIVMLADGTLLVSDDGKVKVGEKTCADLADSERSARMRWIPNP